MTLSPEAWNAFMKSKQTFEDSKTLDLSTIRGRATACIQRAETTRYDRERLEELIAELDGPTVYDTLVADTGHDPLEQGA